MKSEAKKSLSSFALFFGVFFLLLTVQEGCYKKSVSLRGVVLAKHYSPGTSRVGSGTLSSTSSHTVTYRFTTPEGQAREASSPVLTANWTKLRVGDAVDVQYLPATHDSRIAKQTASAPVFCLIALVLLATGVWLRRSAKAA